MGPESLKSVDSGIDQIPKLKDPEYLKELDKKVIKIEKDEKESQHITKVNDVLKKLNLTDLEDDIFRIPLEQLDIEILKKLVIKPKEEIVSFLSQKNNSDDNEETEKRNIENQRINKKISKIKAVFTPEILAKHSDITDQFNLFDSFNDTQTDKKQEAIDNILNYLKKDGVLDSIIADLGGADKNNPKYVEFRNTLIDLDPSFESYLPFLENTNESFSFNTNESIKSIKGDSGEITNIDLNSNPPISKMNLIGSEYSFNKEIDKKALSEIQEEYIKEVDMFKNSFAILQGVYTPFDFITNEVRENWGKQDLKTILKNAVANVSKDVFSKLDDVYKTMEIDSDIQITESDITSFTDINSPDELKLKRENINQKFQKIEAKIGEKQETIKEKRNTKIEQIVQRDSEQKENELKVLEFMSRCGFDELPKDISDRIIKELKSETLTIPGLDMSRKNIDLANGHFGESGAFIDKETGINIQAKTNMVKFMNKLISGSIDEPLSVKAIVNGVSVIDPVKLQDQFLEADVVGGMGWNYGKIMENLRKSD